MIDQVVLGPASLLDVATLAELVSARASVDPSRPAVRCGADRLTWAELDSRCGLVAAALVDQGVAPGDRVGIWLHKSVDSMVAVHAVLRAGAAYVPLDPAASPTVIASVLDDAEVTVVLVGVATRRRDDLVTVRPTTVLVDIGDAGLATHVDGRDRVGLGVVDRSPGDMAYLMYTSGSTGTPKGIVHTHRSGLAYARRAAEVYGLGHDDLLANIAPLHFDQSTFEMFSGPIAGAEVLVVAEPYLRLPASLAALVEEERPTVWYSVPSVLVMLLHRGALDTRDLSSVRWVLFGGEVFAVEHVTALMAHLRTARWSNVYGPAEVNQCTFHHFDTPPPAGQPIPIGQPWGGTETEIVDDELIVRTDTVMDGYWGRPDATAAAFTIGPDGAPGWYRTGDLVERRADGMLVFRGRRDHQVKVRGQRVELEAVDIALSTAPGVSRGAALVETGPDGLGSIVGLIVGSEGRPADTDSILVHLRASLPSYAIPTRFVHVDDLPTTSSGKVNRTAAALLIAESK